MSNLFEIAKEIEALIDPETGEIADFEKFEELAVAKDEKITNIALWILDLDTDVDAYKEQIARFKEKQERAEKKRERLQEYLGLFLAGQEYKDADGRFEIKYKKCPPSVVIDDETILDKRFIKTETVTKIDKVSIKDALKSGDVPGAHLEQNIKMKIE